MGLSQTSWLVWVFLVSAGLLISHDDRFVFIVLFYTGKTPYFSTSFTGRMHKQANCYKLFLFMLLNNND